MPITLHADCVRKNECFRQKSASLPEKFAVAGHSKQSIKGSQLIILGVFSNRLYLELSLLKA